MTPAEPELNPFADSVPFPDSGIGSGYEKAEEVSLEQLLSEGRERPATIGGSVPIPIIPMADDVEELGAEELVEDAPIAVAVEEEAAPAMVGGDGAAAMEIRVRELEEQIRTIRAQHREQLEELLRELGKLTEAVRAQL
jgi:hypothetical protein